MNFALKYSDFEKCNFNTVCLKKVEGDFLRLFTGLQKYEMYKSKNARLNEWLSVDEFKDIVLNLEFETMDPLIEALEDPKSSEIQKLVADVALTKDILDCNDKKTIDILMGNNWFSTGDWLSPNLERYLREKCSKILSLQFKTEALRSAWQKAKWRPKLSYASTIVERKNSIETLEKIEEIEKEQKKIYAEMRNFKNFAKYYSASSLKRVSVKKLRLLTDQTDFLMYPEQVNENFSKWQKFEEYRIKRAKYSIYRNKHEEIACKMWQDLLENGYRR